MQNFIDLRSLTLCPKLYEGDRRRGLIGHFCKIGMFSKTQKISKKANFVSGK